MVREFKIYLRCHRGLYDRRIVSYVISDHNDKLVCLTFKATVKANLMHHCSTVTVVSVHQPNLSPYVGEAGMTQVWVNPLQL